MFNAKIKITILKLYFHYYFALLLLNIFCHIMYTSYRDKIREYAVYAHTPYWLLRL